MSLTEPVVNPEPFRQPNNVVLFRGGQGQLDREEPLLAARAREFDLPISYGSESMMERGRIPLAPGTLVAGSVRFVLHGLRQLGVPAPHAVPYPASLTPWLYREVRWHPRLSDVLRSLDGHGKPVFVKPAEGWKRFTGFVAKFRHDPRFNGVSNRISVWTSEAINLVSEWRVYVSCGEVLAVVFADLGGRADVRPDEKEIHKAVRAFVASGEAPTAFGIDFGVDALGRTVLVEVNDGFALGAYEGVHRDDYWNVSVTRWNELTGRN